MKNVVRLSLDKARNSSDIDHKPAEVLSSFAEPAPKRLYELDFMDLYICLEGEGRAHYCPRTISEHGPLDADVPAIYQDDVDKLANLLRRDFSSIEQGFSFDGVRLRAAKLTTSEGSVWAAMRRLAELPPRLSELGFRPELVPVLHELGQRDGLTLICGSTGQGKTTTASSLLLNYLESYGGVAFTIEDPVEYRLEGRRGKTGYCYQSSITEDHEWGQMLKRALRWHPRFILVGEVRTPDAASQLLRAATSGHKVLATMHAGSMEEALEGLLQLAEAELGDRAPQLLAAGLTSVVHQTLTPLGINAHFMVTEPDNLGSPVRALIRDHRIGQARTFADQQQSLLQTTGKVFQRR